MEQLILLLFGFLVLSLGAAIGYYARQSLAKKRAGTIEAKLQKKVDQTKEEIRALLKSGREKADIIISKAQRETDERQKELLRSQQILLKKEEGLDKKASVLESKEEEFRQKVEKLKEFETGIKILGEEAEKKLERISGLSKEEAKKEFLEVIERQHQKDLSQRLQKLEEQSAEKIEKRAKEILATAIQKQALPQTQEITTTTILLENEDIKGKIIGKEGRNIRAFEKLTGVEIIMDETPDTVVISGFNPLRRQIAKLALEKLIHDGRIQPAKIEEKAEEAKQEINSKIKEMGVKAVYETGIVGLNEKLVQLLGRLYFRTSYGQNVLLHSIEVALLAEALADELKIDSQIAKRAGLLHDIGKAVDHQIQGSHTDIGIKILERFGEEETIIKAMKAHHEEYPAQTLEAIIVKTADTISGSRPGARKDTLENYLQRLRELEEIANSFEGIERSYAIQAGREIRVFVNSNKIDDALLPRLARQIADRIQEELKYPGEIKVTAIRENRVVEYAR